MKCPRCNNELRRSKKDPDFGLCDNCRKKFRWVEEDWSDDYEDDYENDYAYNKRSSRNSAPSKSRSRYQSNVPQNKKGGCLKIALIVIGVLVVIGIIGALFGGGDDKVKDATKSKSGKSSNNEKTEFKVGETADYKGVQVSVLNYEESTGNEFGTPADGKVFVFVNMEITNNTDDEISVSSMVSFESYAGDYKLDYSSEALMAASVEDKQQLDGSISPGKKLQGYLGLEVPSDWQTIEVYYKDNIWLDSNFKFVINK